MMEASEVISCPAYKFIDYTMIDEAAEAEHQQALNSEMSNRNKVRYRTRVQSMIEQEELALAAEFNEINDIKTLS